MSGSNGFESELEALKSIFDSDLSFEGDTIIIRVHSLRNDPESGDFEAQIYLLVTCPDKYPEKLPNISFKNSKGLSNKQITLLSSELYSLAESLKGKPMIYDLAHYVLDYLCDNNRPHKKSFYDEMISRQLQEQAKCKLDEDRRLRMIFNAQQKFKKKMEEEDTSSDEEEDTEIATDEMSANKRNNVKKNIKMEENKTTCNPNLCHCSKYIHFENKVLRGCCIGHDECSSVYCALDTVTGQQLTVHEWNIKSSRLSEAVEKNINSIQNELNYLKRLNHENINCYTDFKCMNERDEWSVYIAEKFVSNITLKTLFGQHWIFDIDLVRYIIKSILKALLYLHGNRVVHRYLNATNIYFTSSGKIRLSSYSVKKRMDDVFRFSRGDELDSKDKTDQKTDIRQLGLILKQIITLTENSDAHANYNKFFEFKDFIEKCLIKNEEKRWGARELLEHKFLHDESPYEITGRRKLSYSRFSDHSDDVPEQLNYSISEQNCRLSKEFDVLEEIGKGSFGKVLKVRNKLDRQIYAIKEIKLDKNNQQVDKKIIGEVKLLSKLKHENVVRYCTSWIESYSDPSSSTFGTRKRNFSKSASESELNEEAEEEEDEDEDDEDDDDEAESSDDGFWQKSDHEDEEDQSIVFEKDDEEEVKIKEVSEKVDNKVRKVEMIRYLYIQMEYCEKSTLKFAIKNNLCEEEVRCWRLFREIVEGLTYIHEQGFIHRDLKPDNIFLDSNDHVKIGDFGLAKIRGVCKSTIVISSIPNGGEIYDSSSHFAVGDSDTAGVGTSYYVAPEVNSAFEKSHYNEKVDIYSLGIIFFEMCHPPFVTAMERHEVLTKLRRIEIIIPSNLEEKMPRQMELVRMLLNNNPALRPSSQEILEDHAPHAEVEFEELKDIVRKTLISPETKEYKYLISSCLNQKISIDDEVTYQLQNFHSDKFHISLEMAKEPIETIFKKHGAVYLSTPLLLPQNEIYANFDGRVKLMTQSGSIVNLAYDLRVPFARYVTSQNIRRLRRYTVDRIHREQKVHGELPKELYECAFDIVSPMIDNLADEWEIFSVMAEVVNSFSSLKSRNCILILNHALILRSLLIYCNVEKYYSEIFKYLMEAKMTKCGKVQLEKNLLSLELGIEVVNTLVKFFGKEESVYALKEEFLTLYNNRREAYEKAEKGFNKLIQISEEAENFGFNIPIKVKVGAVCNTEYCTDIMFDLVCKTKQKKGKQTTEIVMSGCRYDGLLRNFRKLFSIKNVGEGNTSAIGLSISLDKIASFLKEDNILSDYVVVCSTDNWIPCKAKISFIKEMRECGIKCYFEDAIESMQELVQYCDENKITHIVNLKEENGLVLVMSWDPCKCRYRDKKISKREVGEYILKYSKTEEQGMTGYQRSEGRTSSVSESSIVQQSVNIQILSEEKSLTRRKHENQITSKITPFLRLLSPKARIEVIGVDLDEIEISRLAMLFKYDDSSCLSKILSYADRSSKKTYLSKIFMKVESFFTTEKSNVLVIIYGLGHDKYQIITGQ